MAFLHFVIRLPRNPLPPRRYLRIPTMESEDLFDETPDLTNTQLNGLLAAGNNGTATTNGHHSADDASAKPSEAVDDDETQMPDEELVEEYADDVRTDAAEPADEEPADNEDEAAEDDEEDDDATEMMADDPADDGGDGDGDDENAAASNAATNNDDGDAEEGPQPSAIAAKVSAGNETARMSQLPLSRIKALMKLNPDFGYASAEATFLMCKATELFVESLTRESFVYTKEARKKTVQRKDVDKAIESVDALMFLDGAMT